MSLNVGEIRDVFAQSTPAVDERAINQYLLLQQESRADELHKLTLEDERQNIDFRKDFSDRIFTITVLWIFAIIVIVLQVGRGNLVYSDGVLITLITTTTINVLAFLLAVVNYIFPRKS